MTSPTNDTDAGVGRQVPVTRRGAVAHLLGLGVVATAALALPAPVQAAPPSIDEIIAAHEAAHPRIVTVTPKAAAQVTARQLAAVLVDLDSDARFEVLNILLAELARLRAAAGV